MLLHFTDDEIDHRPVNNENTGVSSFGVNASLSHGTNAALSPHTHTCRMEYVSMGQGTPEKCCLYHTTFLYLFVDVF